MARVLMVSPHFPPDTSAATHRVRLLAPHLPPHGWEPTIVTVDPRDYEGRLDHRLAELVPPDLQVVRCRSWPVRWTRRFGVGDLGIRAFKGLHDLGSDLLRRESFDAVFITIFPTYTALLGPIFKRRFGIPFVLDYIDPWVSAWGKTVGGGRHGRPDFKSRLSRALALGLEPHAVRAADAITAVSAATYEQIMVRDPELRRTPCAVIPFGGEPNDFESLRQQSGANPYFDPDDGQIHLCYVGTLLPLGFETLRAVLRAAALLGERRPRLYRRLRMHFFGTSNQTAADAAPRVLAVARDFGVDDRVTEVAPRIDYLEALRVQTQATAILMMGSSEPHYTASKLYPGLLAKRPLLAVYHARSSVAEILRRAAGPPTARLVTYTDTERAESQVEAIFAELSALVENSIYDPTTVDLSVVAEFSAAALGRRLAGVFDHVRR